MSDSYQSSPIKRKRRSKAEIESLCRAIYNVVWRYRPMTVRQVFYQLVSRQIIEKTEAQYKNTVCRLLTEMRRNGQLPFEWIADNTRWMRKPETYSGLASMLHHSQRMYRRAIWEDQECYVEVWLEKEALAGVLVDVTDKWDVPLMVTRGYPSLSFLHTAAEAIASQKKPAFLYYFGDRDPSGVDIDRFVENSIRQIAPNADLTFERAAVTPSQIESFGLVTRPTKKTDSRSKTFKGESVEVDAIEPNALRELCESKILQHVDQHQLEAMKIVEREERRTLRGIIEQLEEVA